jgi:Coproporphyrinogen III oxidase and related Fe-S oxidoreductases
MISQSKYSEAATADLQLYEPKAIFNAGLANHHIANTAYPIDHLKSWNPYRVANSQIQYELEMAWKNPSELALYAHIPFCKTRCYYCEYTVVSGPENLQHDEYMNNLIKEIELYYNLSDHYPSTIKGFDIGGGTPSMVSADWISQLIQTIHHTFQIPEQIEISIESTPSIAAADLDKLIQWYKAGIKRISIGLQVTQPDLLKILNRAHDGLDHHKLAVENIRQAGFQKLNLDLMYGFARQSLSDWEHTLAHAISLNPDTLHYTACVIN